MHTHDTTTQHTAHGWAPEQLAGRAAEALRAAGGLLVRLARAAAWPGPTVADRDAGPDVQIEPTPCPICSVDLIVGKAWLTCENCRARWDATTGTFAGWLDPTAQQCTAQVYLRQRRKTPRPGSPTVRCVREQRHEVTPDLDHISYFPNGSLYVWPNRLLVEAPDAEIGRTR